MYGNLISKNDFGKRLTSLKVEAGYLTDRSLALVLCGYPKDCKGLMGSEADRVEYTRKNINNWCLGKNIPPVQTIATLCNLFDCVPEYLLYEDATDPRPDNKTVEEITGLSKDAVKSLIGIYHYGPTVSHQAINRLLEAEKMWEFLSQRAERITGENILHAIGGYLSKLDNGVSLYRNIPNEQGSKLVSPSTLLSVENYIMPATHLIKRTQLDGVIDSLKQLRERLDKCDNAESQTDTKPIPAP